MHTEVKPSDPNVPVLTHASLVRAVEQLCHQLTTLQGLLRASEAELKQVCQEQ